MNLLIYILSCSLCIMLVFLIHRIHIPSVAKLLFSFMENENIGKRNLQRKPHENVMLCMYFVYDSLRTVTLEIYGVLVSGFISLLLYFITETIHISFRGTFRNLQNFSKLLFKRRHFIMLFMINTFELSPHACYQNESSTKV